MKSCVDEDVGSSPLARGTHRCPDFIRVGDGIIPACAGNTPALPSELAQEEDHPRLRGEHPFFFGFGYFGLGSSPLARGTLFVDRHRRSQIGIIPACAGNTLDGLVCDHLIGDHPRLRGEHLNAFIPRRIRLGSSPLARGTHQRGCRRMASRRIIPACAGNTRSICWPSPG